MTNKGVPKMRGTRIANSKRRTLLIEVAIRASDSPETSSVTPISWNGLLHRK